MFQANLVHYLKNGVCCVDLVIWSSRVYECFPLPTASGQMIGLGHDRVNRLEVLASDHQLTKVASRTFLFFFIGFELTKSTDRMFWGQKHEQRRGDQRISHYED